MQAARRIYLYLLTGISLGALVIGVSMLLSVLFVQIGLAGDPIAGGADDVPREQLTVAAALTVVSLPVWLIHWTLAERSVRDDRPDGMLELNAPERGLFFALALGALYAVFALSLASAAEPAIIGLAGASAPADGGGNLARAAVAFTAWAYHVRVRDRDWRRRTLTEQAAFLPRAYRYLAAFVGLLVALFAITGLMEVAAGAMVGAPPVDAVSDDPWWALPLAQSIVGIVVGGGTWAGHWRYSDRLAADEGPRGASERASQLRLAFFVAVIVAAAALTLTELGETVGALIRLAVGDAGAAADGETLRQIVEPLLGAVVFGATWWLHARWLDAEASTRASADGAATAHRLRLYSVAIVGLAFGAVGTAWLIALVVRVLLGASSMEDVLGASELAQFAPYAVLGWITWAWARTTIARRTALDPVGEALSTARRAMFLLALAGSVLAGLYAAGSILYRVFGSLFGVDLGPDAVSELGLPIGALVVAIAIGIGHGVLLRRDGRLREAAGDARSAEARSASATVVLRLTGPRDGLEAAVASIGSAMPSGYALEIAPEERVSDA